MEKLSRYGKNQWKLRILNALTFLLIFIVGCFVSVGIGICIGMWQESEAYLEARGEREKREDQEFLEQQMEQEESLRVQEEQQRLQEELQMKLDAGELPEEKQPLADKQIPDQTEEAAQIPISYFQTQEQSPSEAATQNDYIISNSNRVYLTKSDVQNLSLQQVNYAKNEIYARRGRKFKSTELQNYFNAKPWYSGTIEASSFSDSVFNDYEKANVKLLSEVEHAMNPDGYQLDQ